MRDAKNVALGVLASLVTAALAYLYSTFRLLFFVGVGVLVVGALVTYVPVFVFDGPKRRKRYAQLLSRLSEKNQVGNPQFFVEPTEMPTIRNRLLGRSVRRPTVFMQLKVKDFLSWIDVCYVLFVKQLSRAGFRAYVLIHDYQYLQGGDSAPNEVRSAKRHSFSYDLEQFATGIRKVAGNGVRVVMASRFFADDQNAATVVNSFYGGFLPILSRMHDRDSMRREASSIEFLRFLMGLFAINIFGKKSLCISLVWEERKTWISEWRHVYEGGNAAFIYCSTIRSIDGKPIGVEYRQDSVCLDDKQGVLERKVSELDSDILSAMWNNLVTQALSPTELHRLQDSDQATTSVTPDVLIRGLLAVKRKFRL